MPERIEKLQEIVRELEAELENLDSVGPQSREVLEGALDELRTALGKQDTASLESDSLADRFREAETDFQVSHPTLAGIVLRVINALGQLGI
jgi:hypothetical protein